MAIKLNSARDDVDAQTAGDWANPTSCPDPDVRFKVRGLNYTPFTIARDKARAKLVKQYPAGIPAEIWSPILGRLLGEHILFEQEGLMDDDGKTALAIDEIKKALTDPGHVNLRSWVCEAAASVGEASIEFVDAAAGN